jgi:type II secretory pathway pseudopilin PulG
MRAQLISTIVGRPGRRSGTTVTETIFVIVLIGIFSALAIPKINVPGFRADASARQVRMTLQVAQRLAVTRQYDVIVSFDTVNQTIRMVEDLNNNGVADAGERVTWHPLHEGTHFAVPPAGIFGPVTQSVSGPGSQTIDGMPSIIFMRSGASDTDLEVYVTSLDAAADYFRGVSVTQPTGRTAYEKYLNSIWTAASI